MKKSLFMAVDWLVRAQVSSKVGGVAATNRLLLGWSDPYPETTGYIIPTLLAVAREYDRQDLLDNARAMGRWLLTLQADDGSFPGGVWNPKRTHMPSVFNSGQILFGLIALWQEDQEECWYNAVIKCAQWLCAMQDEDGAWRKYCYRNTLHVYKTRVAWAVLMAGKVFERQDFVSKAVKNLRSAVEMQTANGWFNNCAFNAGDSPVLHTFAYTVRGLFEGGLLLDDDACINAATLSARQLLALQDCDGSLPGEITANFSREGSYRCLTGIAQTAIIWSRMVQSGMLDNAANIAAERAVDYLAQMQVKRQFSNNNGGFAGSQPIWGKYMRFRYPNWAAKFFIDAVLVQSGAMSSFSWG